MSLEVVDLALRGLKLVRPRRHGDGRGFFSETYNRRDFALAGIACEFVQDNHSRSSVPGVVRGLHFQRPPHAQDKLVRVVAGRIVDIAVDIRRGSPTYGAHVAVELSAENWSQLFVPVGFAHGFCTLEPNTEVIYKVTDYYAPACEDGILWNDPALGIAWPTFAGAQLSPKDLTLPTLQSLESPFSDGP